MVACLPLIGLFSYLKTVCWNTEAFCIVNALLTIQVNFDKIMNKYIATIELQFDLIG